jgi:hypothetical protein
MLDKTRHPATSLIPDIDQWNNGRGIDLEDWIQCVGSYPDAIGYSSIFWPRIVEHNGYVLICPFNESVLADFEKSANGNRAAIEATMNHRHMELLFQSENCNWSEERITYLGETLAEIYRAKLAQQFPDKRFTVEYDRNDDRLTFFQSND